MSLSCLKPKVKTIDTRRGSRAAVDRIRGHALNKIRQRILLRDDYTCRVCKRVSVDLVVDHIVPLHLGGAESDENRQSICFECHKVKSEREEKERA